jgi:hypothetical protein
MQQEHKTGTGNARNKFRKRTIGKEKLRNLEKLGKRTKRKGIGKG